MSSLGAPRPSTGSGRTEDRGKGAGEIPASVLFAGCVDWHAVATPAQRAAVRRWQDEPGRRSQWLEPRELWSIQERVHAGQLVEVAMSASAQAPIDVVRVGQRLLIKDGHHRAAAVVVARRLVRAHVYELGPVALEGAFSGDRKPIET